MAGCSDSATSWRLFDSNINMPLRGIEWVILAWFRGSVFFSPILLFDRHHPSIPTCTRYLPARAAAVKDAPSGHRFSGAKRP
jgi:hypothetical protein